MFHFAELLKLENRAMQAVLSEARPERIALALKGITDERRCVVFAALPEQVKVIVDSEMSESGRGPGARGESGAPRNHRTPRSISIARAKFTSTAKKSHSIDASVRHSARHIDLAMLAVLALRIALRRESSCGLPRPGARPIHTSPPPMNAGVPLQVLIAIAGAESAYHPWALDIEGRQGFCQSRAEAEMVLANTATTNVDIGLMQINWRFWGSRLGIAKTALLDPRINLLMGARILRDSLAVTARRGAASAIIIRADATSASATTIKSTRHTCATFAATFDLTPNPFPRGWGLGLPLMSHVFPK